MHALGLGGALSGALVLAGSLAPPVDAAHAAGIAVYVAGAVTMFACSALYNLARPGPAKRILQRFDHAAIFLMIAGTYTPFALFGLGGALGLGLLAVVWAAAIACMALKLVDSPRIARLSVLPYVALGWIGLAVVPSLVERMAGADLLLLLAGGVLYSCGVVFHLWRTLRYHTAIWHGFVLAGAAVQFAAVRNIAAG